MLTVRHVAIVIDGHRVVRDVEVAVRDGARDFFRPRFIELAEVLASTEVLGGLVRADRFDLNADLRHLCSSCV
jgi:hypothetical protein